MTTFAALVAAGMTVVASPSASHPHSQVRIAVTGLNARAALVVLHGGIARQGRWFGWVPLRSDGSGRWSALLQTPGLFGVYPVRVRVGNVVHLTAATVEVVPRGFSARPGFATPVQVAQWWAWIAKPGIVIRSVAPWHTGFYTHRDPEYNRLLRVQFQLLGNWPQQHLRAGAHVIYLSVARHATSSPWRLVETVTAP